MTGRIFVKLICGVLALLALTLVVADLLATEVAKQSYILNLTQQLEGKGRMLAVWLADPRHAAALDLAAMASAAGGRITVVHADGSVALDSEADPAFMENHRTRPEISEALAGRAGSGVRHSATIGIDFLYVAVPGPGYAVRIAVPLARIDAQVNSIRWNILASTCLAFLPAIAIAALLARWISARFATIMAHAGELARGNFRARLKATGPGEFGLLGRTLNETAGNLEQAAAQLEREHAELDRVERVRKDFVINVSHELRTPLASIQGYTETLIDGALYDPDHNMRFLGIIRHNAERLARLTEDLLTLSRVEQKQRNSEFACHRVSGLLDDGLELIRPMIPG